MYAGPDQKNKKKSRSLGRLGPHVSLPFSLSLFPSPPGLRSVPLRLARPQDKGHRVDRKFGSGGVGPLFFFSFALTFFFLFFS